MRMINRYQERRRHRVILSTVVGCAAVSMGTCIAPSIKTTQRSIGYENDPGTSRTVTARRKTILAAKKIYSTRVPVTELLAGFRKMENNRVVQRGSSRAPRNGVSSGLRVCSVQTTGHSLTRLHYRNSIEADYSQSERLQHGNIVSNDTGARTVTVPFFSWCVNQFAAVQTDDDLDRYRKFLDHRYHRLYNDDICFDDHCTFANASHRQQHQTTGALEGVRIVVRVVNFQLPNAFSKPSNVGDSDAGSPTQLHKAESDESVKKLISLLPPAVSEAKFVTSCLHVVRTCQLRHAAYIAAQRKLIMKYVKLLSASVLSFLASVGKKIHVNATRKVRTSAAFVMAVFFLCKPMFTEILVQEV